MGKLCCAREQSCHFFLQFFTQLNCTVRVYGAIKGLHHSCDTNTKVKAVLLSNQKYTVLCHRILNPFRSYVGSGPILWFSCSRHFSWSLTLSNPIFLPPTYSPPLIYFGQERGWWVTCNYPTVLKEKNINRNRKITTCAICWLKPVLHEKKRRTKSDIMIFLFPTLFLM
jgi:hypothetical protein